MTMKHVVSMLLMSCIILLPAYADMMKDSPVTFPKEGALPAKYPPDIKVQSEPAEHDYYIFSSPCRSLTQIEEIQANMPKGEFTLPLRDWAHLQHTRQILTQGGELRLLAMGDSIVNDMMRSGWVAKLREAYPKAEIKATVYARGGGGCQHYKENGRIAKNVVPRKPDLVLIGGISQKSIEDIREVIHQLRAALPNVEIILATGAFGTTDPRDAEVLAKAAHSGTGAYGQSLKKLVAEEQCAYLDMTVPWAEYIRSSKLHPHRFYRDVVHANEYGEQILSKILISFFDKAAENNPKANDEKGELLGRCCRIAYYPERCKIRYLTDLSTCSDSELVQAITGGSFSVRKIGDARPLAQTELTFDQEKTAQGMLELPDLVDVEYEGVFTFDGAKVTVPGLCFERVRFAWEGNRLGITDEVYPPFEPVRVEDKTARVVMREYSMNGFGLLDQAISKGRDLLAKPMSLVLQTADGPQRWTFADSRWEGANPQRAIFRSHAVSDTLEVRTVSTIEFDGCMKVEMELAPGQARGEIQRLWIEIVLKNKEAPLFHEVSDYIRKNYSGFTPAGVGVVWDSTKSRRTAKWQNPFTSYIWLGAEERGLCWFAENDKNWITEKGENARPVQELIRTGDTLTLRVYLVNTPAIIKEKYALVFGLQASPTKPIPENWRAKTITMPGGSGPVNPWGGLHCGYKGPFRNDWQIVDKIIEAQRTGIFDEAWFNDYVAKYNPPPCYGNWNWLESCRVFAGMRQRPAMTYQEELIQSVVQPEWQTFQDEWRNAGTLGTEISEFTQRDWPTEEVFREKDPKKRQSNPSMYINYCRSYQDYGCWYANEWFKRGVSAYWDNTFPKYTYNTQNSAAYRMSDGKVQPVMVIWNEREYMKRVWNLLQYWRRHQSDPLEWSHHMTDALILPFESWATVILSRNA